MEKIILDPPTVSVVMITYGHEKYIRSAIEGVFIQKTDFAVEFIIANDCSPDDTEDVIKSMLVKAPRNITVKHTCHKKNIGMMQNFIWALGETRGAYIALCEGDDYWTDPHKLQKQVDFLRANPSCGAVCTNFTAPYLPQMTKINSFREISGYEMLFSSPVGTLTTMFRKNLINDIKWDTSLMMGDYPLWLHLVKKAKFCKISDTTAAYNVLQNSASGRNNIRKQINFEIDVIKVTLNNINDFQLSKKEKAAVIRERFGYLFTLVKGKKEFMKYFTIYIKTMNLLYFNMLDFKMLVKKIIG